MSVRAKFYLILFVMMLCLCGLAGYNHVLLVEIRAVLLEQAGEATLDGLEGLDLAAAPDIDAGRLVLLRDGDAVLDVGDAYPDLDVAALVAAGEPFVDVDDTRVAIRALEAASGETLTAVYAPDGHPSMVPLGKLRTFTYGGLGLLLLITAVGAAAFVERSVVGKTRRMARKMVEITEDRADLSDRLDFGNRDEFAQLAGCFNDLMDRIRSVLHASEQLSGYLRQLPAPVFMVDRDHVVTFANDAAQGLVDGAPCVGAAFDALLGVEGGEGYAAGRAEGRQGAVTRERWVSPAGKRIPVRTTGLPMLDEHGRNTGTLVFVVELDETYEIVDALGRVAHGLSSASGQLSEDAAGLDSGASTMSTDSSQVSEAASDFARSVDDIYGSTTELTASVSVAAAAVEEMSAMLVHVSANTASGSEIATTVHDAASTVGERMKQLEALVTSIGRVANFIDDIADQTNLLALNATIEAAGAGAAGKGFAVVASEVKQLARQTAKATEEIRDQTQEIQAATSRAVVEVQGIIDSIAELANVSHSNAAAVEQQSAAVREIAHTLATTSQVAEDINHYVAGASAGSETISQRIEAMDGQIQSVAGYAHDTADLSGSLVDMAGRMQEIVGRFPLVGEA